MGREAEVRTFHVTTGATEERAFILEIRFWSGGKVRLKTGQLMDAISRLFVWQGKAAESATILDSEGTVVVSSWTTGRMWKEAARDPYSASYIVRGSVGRSIEEHPSRSLRKAIGFAVYWRSGSWDGSDWTHVIDPTNPTNDRVVLSHRELWRMYRGERWSRGLTVEKNFVRRRRATL